MGLRTLDTRLKRWGLNQNRYATLVGISRCTLSDIEGDQSNVTLEVKNRVYQPPGLEVSILLS